MKKTIITLTAVAAVFASANAQSLVAGWSFSGYTGGGNAGPTADLSDPLLDGALGTIDSQFYFDGSFGSTDILNNGGAGVVYNGSPNNGLGSNADITTRPSAQDFQAGGAGDDGFVIDNYAVLALDNFVIEVNTGDGPFNTWSFSYAASESGDGIGLGWAWSVDGSSWVSIGSDSISGADSGSSYSGFADGVNASSLYLQGTFTGFATDNGGGERLVMDNFAVYGTAVPEPSAFAAIAGVMALAFVAVRRRK